MSLSKIKSGRGTRGGNGKLTEAQIQYRESIKNSPSRLLIKDRLTEIDRSVLWLTQQKGVNLSQQGIGEFLYSGTRRPKPDAVMRMMKAIGMRVVVFRKMRRCRIAVGNVQNRAMGVREPKSEDLCDLLHAVGLRLEPDPHWTPKS